jgi:NADP-dependent 3-hydroxy acid dehydrogenase YdfG
MKRVSDPLAGAVVVITGASSGFGRAAALAFVRAGARVSLGGRGRGALDDTARAVSKRVRRPW